MSEKNIRRRDELESLPRAVSDTLDEYLIRIHGITTSWTHPTEFIDWLNKRGYRITAKKETINLYGIDIEL